MAESTYHRKRQLVLRLCLLLVVGFLTTTLVSYLISRESLRTQIASSTLPLTSDNIYSEIQRDLLRPILISSLMANDTFLRDWILEGEKNVNLITKYLAEVKEKHDAFTSFLVSESTKAYYHPGGILKHVRADEPRDIWYFRVRDMSADYEINVDHDMANQDAMTIFINHRVLDYEGKFIGATGVGLNTGAVIGLIENYHRKFGRHVFFTDTEGNVTLCARSDLGRPGNIHTMEGVSAVAEKVLSKDRAVLSYVHEGGTVHLNTRFIPELKWYLLVEQREEEAVARIHDALILNLILCAVITAVAMALTTITINLYERVTREQQEEIVTQHETLLAKNNQLEEALSKVRQLSGLLPICASCKKIRDDKGYWQQIDSYVRDHSEAQFSHGICPDCAKKLYPELNHKKHEGPDATRPAPPSE